LRVITGTTLALEKAIDERAKESQKHNEYMMLAARTRSNIMKVRKNTPVAVSWDASGITL